MAIVIPKKAFKDETPISVEEVNQNIEVLV